MRIFKWLWFTAFAVCGLVGFAIAFLFIGLYIFAPELPDHNALRQYSPALASRVFLQDGSKLCEYAKEKRYFIPYDRIPKKLVHAFVAVEDKNFFKHPGLDFRGIIRSALTNLQNIGSGKRPQGASTITQQVARIFLIKTNKVSYIRKLKEAILSYRIEHALTKPQILELYLNQIYLGMGVYGVAAAAKVYFDKSVDELTVEECSYLAALAKGANAYHPIRHHDKALARRNWAIKRQLDDGYITKEEADEALATDLITNLQQERNKTAEYFEEEIRKTLIDDLKIENLDSSGLIVRATLSPDFQKCAYEALRAGLEKIDRGFGWRGPVTHIEKCNDASKMVRELKSLDGVKYGAEYPKAIVLVSKKNAVRILTEGSALGELAEEDVKWAKKLSVGDVIFVAKEDNIVQNKKSAKKNVFRLKQIPKVQGALVVIETKTGRILAMQGGYSFQLSEFNRAIQAERQTGSAFKPFVYLTGLENGFAPNTMIDASPLAVEIGSGNSKSVWRPKNYKGQILDGITFRRAIEKSVNTATIRIAQQTGIEKISEIAQRFGLFDYMPPYLSFAIGAGETTLLKLTTAYAMFANGGKKITPIIVDYVQDKYGNTLFKSNNCHCEQEIAHDTTYPPNLEDNRPQILDERSIYQLNSLLEGVVQRGSAARAAYLGFPIAGKTGTSNESRDLWFIGYTPDIAVGVFVGFDDHQKSLGKNASGTSHALPIFIDFMEKIKPLLKPRPFKVPRGIKLRKIDAETGGPITSESKFTVWEAFKEGDSEERPALFEPQESEGDVQPIDGKNADRTDKKANNEEKIKFVQGIY